MKNKNNKLLTIFTSICICLMACFLGANYSMGYTQAVYAEEIVSPEEDPSSQPEGGEGSSSGSEAIDYDMMFSDGFKLTESDIPDENLRRELLNIYKRTTGYSTIDALYSTMFNSEQFKSISLDNKNISVLQGLELLQFNYLESLSLNINAITSFSKDYLRNTSEKFTSISLAGNELTSVDFSELTRLTYVDVSSNKLTRLDLSKIVVSQSGTDIYVNVAGNKINSMDNIILPEHRIGKTTLNIVNNNIKTIESKYFDGNKYLLAVGVQGVTDGKFDTAQTIDFYKTNLKIKGQDVAMEVWRIDGEEDVVVDVITDDMIAESGYVLSKKYPIGKYYFQYVYSSGDEYISAGLNTDPARRFYNSGQFNIIPQKPIVTFTYKNKTTDTLSKVTGKVTVNISSPEEGAKIYYQLNGKKEWIEGDTIKCEKGGSYSIKIKVTVMSDNGKLIDSEIKDVLVRTSLNLYISDGVMLVIVALFALSLFFVVVPIISKKYFKRD